MIDLQEKMETEEKKNKEKIHNSSSYSESRDSNVYKMFSTRICKFRSKNKLCITRTNNDRIVRKKFDNNLAFSKLIRNSAL